MKRALFLIILALLVSSITSLAAQTWSAVPYSTTSAYGGRGFVPPLCKTVIASNSVKDVGTLTDEICYLMKPNSAISFEVNNRKYQITLIEADKDKAKYKLDPDKEYTVINGTSEDLKIDNQVVELTFSKMFQRKAETLIKLKPFEPRTEVQPIAQPEPKVEIKEPKATEKRPNWFLWTVIILIILIFVMILSKKKK